MGRRLHRFLKSEQLESRRPLAADLAALDVNDDMSVTALDALIVINEINQRSTGNVTAAEAEGQLDCDTNNDGVVTPVDALNVVNQINSGVVTVPADTTDTTISDPVVSAPSTDSDDTSALESTPVDETNVTSPGDSATDDSPTDESSSDGSDSIDDSTDPSDQLDETDGTDDSDVVSQPTDGDEDTTGDDTPDDSTDETTDDETSAEDETGCEHDTTIGDSIRRASLLIRGRHGHGDLFAHLDTDGDGALSSDEVSERLWEYLVDADADASDSVTKEELHAYREAQRLAAVEAFFDELDRDGSGTLTSADVSRLAWRFLSRADSNDDGEVTVDELMAVPLPGRWGRS